MATVYLAHDLRHDRSVALKVLHPDLAASLGPERFQREIRYAARLQHPHILTLLDSGESAGQFWFTMPYVEGESLRDRLRRDRQLPIEDALGIGREAAQALQYAHEHDVLHRDIKPENILLTRDGNTLVADFGVARALVADEGLTQTGLTVGTPPYMSPEQAAGERQLDARSDIYSLGCVIYEMLTGEPPFTGASAQAIMAKRFGTSPTPMRVTRPGVPAEVDDVVQRTLARAPADRFGSAGELAQALRSGVATPTATRVLEGTPETAELPQRRAAPQRTRWLVAGGVAALTLVAMVAFMRSHAGQATLDPRAVAVFPFRVTGADPSLAYLREGMVELLAVKLTGEGGPRAVDPSVTLSAWRRAGGANGELDRRTVLRAARSIGAGRVVEGSVVGSPTRLTLTAAVLRESGNEARFSVEGPLDSLSGLVDRLTAGVLASGDAAGALSNLTTASLPALRAYLDGRSFYRRGSYRQAVTMFERALALDSGFALAGLDLANAAGWCCADSLVERGIRLAWSGRSRLGLPDRAVLEAMAGPRYPGVTSGLERLRAWEHVVEVAPDRPGAWYRLGDIQYHFGLVLGIPDGWARAERAFERALELDSTFAGPLEHMAEMAAHNSDSTSASRMVALALASDSTSEVADYLRWRVLVANGDTNALSEQRLDVNRWPAQSLFTGLIVVVHDRLPITEARPLMAVADRRTGTREEREFSAYYHWAVGLNAGRPLEALQGLRRDPNLGEDPWTNHEKMLVQAAFWDGDSVAAAAAARELIASAGQPRGNERLEGLARLCALEQWNLARGDLAGVARTLTVLAHADSNRSEPEASSVAAFCSRMLDAWQAMLRRLPGAPRKLASLDSASRTLPPDWLEHFQHANLLLSRLYEAQGDLPRALESVRRRHYGLGIPLYLSSYLREEGRLAALTGDRTGAITAYRHYLALRQDPEPSLRPQVDQVRREMARLLAEH
jgi:tetratricopeptide (TPR) repeat protein